MEDRLHFMCFNFQQPFHIVDFDFCDKTAIYKSNFTACRPSTFQIIKDMRRNKTWSIKFI
jgi:hypothetical protein